MGVKFSLATGFCALNIMKDLTGILCFLFIVIAPINFIAYGFHYETLGGDAINGHRTHRHFYVSDHGHETEVTKSQWYYMRWHAVSLWITSTLGLCSILLAIFRDAFPKPILWSADERAQIVRQIQGSGRRQIELDCSGKFRSINIWFLRVAVYPGGLVCQIRFIADIGILASEIDSITPNASSFSLDPSLSIVHISPYLGSPLSLRCADEEAASKAMQALLSLIS